MNISKTLIELFQNRAEFNGDSRAYTFLKNGETEVSFLDYAEIDRASRVVANYLQEITNFGDRVILMYPPGLDFITGFLGCLYAGVIAVPAYAPNTSRIERLLPRLSAIVLVSDSKIILSTSDLSKKLSSLVDNHELLKRIRIIETDLLDPARSAHWLAPKISADSLALLQFTSGSTSEPKGVMVSHGNIIHNLKFIHEREENNQNSISVSWLPAFHDMGLLEGILSPAYGAYPLYLMSPLAFMQRPIRWLAAISKYRATNSGGPNFAYEYCVQAINESQRESLDLDTWRVAYNGAEPVRFDTLKKFNATFSDCGFNYDAFYPVYGLAESTAMATTIKSDTTLKHKSSNDYKSVKILNHIMSCGFPDQPSGLRIVNPDTCLKCVNGEQGEIWLSGPSVAQGYWADPINTDRVFNAHILDSGEGPFLRTGDLGFLTAGELFVTGRIKDLIIIRGRKLFPQDIENSIALDNPLIQRHGIAAFSVETKNSAEPEQLVVVAELNLRACKKTEDYNKNYDTNHSKFYQSLALDIVDIISREHETRVTSVLIVSAGQLAKTSSGKLQRYKCRDQFLSDSFEYLYSWSLLTKIRTADNYCHS